MPNPPAAFAHSTVAPELAVPTHAAGDRILPGILLMLAFCVLAPLLDVSSKLAAEGGIPVGQITAARFVVQCALILPVAWLMRVPMRVSPRALALSALRAALLVFSTFAFVSGVAVMPLADALAIVFVEPFILLILGYILFGEQVGPRRIVACLVGFGGALFVIQPSLTAFGLIALWPLATAFSFAFYMLVTRELSKVMHPVAMQAHTSWIGVLISVPVLWFMQEGPIPALHSVMPEGWQWLWLFGVGFWAAASHGCMTQALAWAPAATLAPLHYFEIVIAVILGYLIFDDLPNEMTFTGIAIVVGSGLYIIYRERLTHRTQAKTALPPTL
ncbi:DMT family transporter [Xinfangfangia sp. CPCC 101601]|uniref:DMT family transporter n=1 Tax=Pseudogemmobacter lacusdianii TaxID=3069608 RepID=A0ABU0VX36_9RHOB|nr:DMT family transporter [Xinfangfangia sp. CPCC 101601]MDQ2065755.1 DMT family transporter [Xinfangfangia sp. CPCC 101601]